MIISRSGKHESAERKTTIRGEENANPRKERGNTPKERTSCNIHYTENWLSGLLRGFAAKLKGTSEPPARRPPPLTEPERNAEWSAPTVTNSRTAKLIHRRPAIVAFLSEPVKGKPPKVGGYPLPPVLNLRTAYGFVSKCVPCADRCVPCFELPFSLLRIGAFLIAKYSLIHLLVNIHLNY